MAKQNFITAAGGLTNILNAIIILVLMALFFHNLKRLKRSWQVGVFVLNLVLLAVLYLVMARTLLETFFLLFLIDLVVFAVAGIRLKQEERRLNELEEQLVNALLILSGSLKAGRSLEQGFDLVQKSLSPPISHEFMTVLQDQSLGIPFDKALKSMAERIPSKDFRLFVTATLFQRETGGNIIALYDEIISATADRKKMRGKMKAMSIQGQYSGYIIAALPIALFAVLAIMNREYVMVFWNVEWAKTLFVLAIVLEVTGIVAIRGILNRKVG